MPAEVEEAEEAVARKVELVGRDRAVFLGLCVRIFVGRKRELSDVRHAGAGIRRAVRQVEIGLVLERVVGGAEQREAGGRRTLEVRSELDEQVLTDTLLSENRSGVDFA